MFGLSFGSAVGSWSAASRALKRTASLEADLRTILSAVGAVSRGLIAGRRPRIGYGLVFGAALWLTGHAVLPAMRLYNQVWENDAARFRRTCSPISYME